jgi:hypothetical protein
VTFLFTDVEGSTRRWEDDADGMRVALERTMSGDLNAAIELSQATANHLFDVGGTVWTPVITAVLVEATPATWQRRRHRGSGVPPMNESALF